MNSFNWSEFATWTTEDVRNLAVAFGAIGAIIGGAIGLPFLIVRSLAARRSAQAAVQQSNTALQRASADFEAALETRVTDLFARAVHQLGANELSVRLGGIYALERIARESSKDHWPIMEILTAFIRERRVWPVDEEFDAVIEDRDDYEPLPEDIFTALIVIGRRKTNFDRDDIVLCLDQSDLSNAVLTGLNFENVSFSSCRLFYANFDGAKLRGCFFTGSDLRGADFLDADLREVVMGGAELEKSRFCGADLSGGKWGRLSLRVRPETL